MSSEPKAVAWQYRFNTQEGWGDWYDCKESQLHLFKDATDSEVRPLYDEQALSALRAEVLRLDRLHDEAVMERDTLRAEVEALRKYARRYLALKELGARVVNSVGGELTEDALDSAIDAMENPA